MFEEILNIIKPKKEEKSRIYETINNFIKILENEGLEIFLGGSFAKDTWLSGDYDVDLFVLFDREDIKMSEKIEKVLINKNFNYQRIKGSRDYFKVLYNDINFELVPILKIDDISEAKNVTDLSPFHVKYVLEKIKNSNLNDEIRLLKAFAKCNNLYGAESYMRGFSGYVCELLIIHYRSFYNLIKNAVFWKPKVFIDLEKYYPSLEDSIKALGKDKTKSPLVIIDPTNPRRNAASALSVKKFAEFIYYSNLLIRDIENNNNILGYFIKKDKNNLENYLENSKKYRVNLLYLEIEGKGNNPDIKNSKALKIFKKIIKNLKEHDFSILGKKIFFEKEKLIAFLYIFPKNLPEYELRKGPYVWNHESFEKFIEKHKGREIFIEEDGRVSIITKRRFYSVELLLESLKQKFSSNVDKISYKIY